MGYNIGIVTEGATGGPDQWTYTIDLTDPTITTVSGDFNEDLALDRTGTTEVADGYSFTALSTNAYGTLSYNGTTGEFVFTIDRDAVFASGSDQVVSFQVTGVEGDVTDTATIFINLLICVARGTLIETEHGPVPVEEIQPGQRVMTLDAGPQPVRWVGSRRVSRAELAAEPALRPITIAAGALGDGVPARKLTVSPQHRVLLTDWRAELMFGEREVLVPAKGLVNDTTVRIEQSCAPVEYFHLLFDSHQVIFTNGAPTESFHPNGYALGELGDAVRVELQRLFPELFDGSGYGETARLSLRPWEGALILAAPATAQPMEIAG